MKRLKVDLKTFLGLAMSNQCCHAVTKLILGWFVGGIFGQETLMIPMHSTTILYDTTCVEVQRCRLVFIMHLFLTGKDCQILPGQYLDIAWTIFSQRNVCNARNARKIRIICVTSLQWQSFAATEMCVICA